VNAENTKKQRKNSELRNARVYNARFLPEMVTGKKKRIEKGKRFNAALARQENRKSNAD